MKQQSFIAFEHLKCLAGFGPRPIGSDANHAAANYIRGVFESCKLPVEMQDYPCLHWQPGLARLDINATALDVRANPYSPDCDFAAETVACSSLAELEAASLEGKILVVHGALASNPIVPEYVVYAQGPDALAETIKAKKPAAVIAVEVNPLNPFLFLEDWTFSIPNARVLAASGRVLLQNAGGQARLQLQSTRIESATANVVARQPASREKRITVCAHFDTTFDTPGAMDNASGVAVLLALAECFSAQSPRHALEWVAFSGEDSGGVDFFPYAEKHPDFENIRAAINIDAVSTWLGTTSITLLGDNPAVDAAVNRLVAANSDLVRVDPWYESDHTSFFFRGVPAIAFSTKGFPAEILHRAGDTPDWIDPAKLARAVDLVAQLIHLLDETEYP